MEDIRPYRIEEEDGQWQTLDDEREFSAPRSEEEVPFHIPRD